MKKVSIQTILITGSSTGIGYETAIYLSKKGYKVYAGMREVNDNLFTINSNIVPIYIDVTDINSIKSCLSKIEDNGDLIDIIINNAGFGIMSPFESMSNIDVQNMYNVNFFGILNLIKLILPLFKRQGQGKIINISSIGGRMSYPFYSIYHSTKWALEGFSESLYYELKPLNIQVKLIEPGATKSNFFKVSNFELSQNQIVDYEKSMKIFENKSIKTFKNAIDPKVVAKEIYLAIIDKREKLRFPVGNSKSMFILFLLKILPNHLFLNFIKKSISQ